MLKYIDMKRGTEKMYALTSRGMKYIDEFTIRSGISSSILMENAARGVVNEITAKFPRKDTRILVLVGSGNNGGDGICVSRWLMHMGYSVSIYFLGDAGRTSEEFIRQLQILRNRNNQIKLFGTDSRADDLKALNAKYDIIIDGIFGIGLNKRIGNNLAKFINYINQKEAYKISIDIPSGLNATTGRIMGAAFIADMTVSFSCYKIGMLIGEGRRVSGEVKIHDIGACNDAYTNILDKIFVCDDDFLRNNIDKALLPRDEKSHKGTFGTVGIAVGTGSMLGASMLAAKAAYRAGTGLVKIFCPRQYTGFFNVSIPEAVVVPYVGDDIIGEFREFAGECDSLLIGPGLKEDNTGRDIVLEALKLNNRIVFDAGALNIISRNLGAFKRRKCQAVITPHIGELARLVSEETDLVEKNKILFTYKFSDKYKVSMVSKSDVSLVALNKSKNIELYLNTIGNSGLATAGSGDVLAGIIASLIAQGNSMEISLLYGVMVHGMAAKKIAPDEVSRRKMMAGDIADNIFTL